jgi:hypothetical protein
MIGEHVSRELPLVAVVLITTSIIRIVVALVR